MKRQRGVALLTVLLLVAVMTALVVAVLDDIRFGLRRTANAQAVAQAQRYALGAETLARLQIDRLARRDPTRTTLEGQWNGRPFVFPLGGGTTGEPEGMISARVSDASACFNLNSVVEGVPGMWLRRELGIGQYIALLEALDFAPGQARAMADALADWIDSDLQRSPAGAEDPQYALRGDGYRTGGTLLAETSELRAVAGYDPATYARIRPHVCALPDTALSPININTLQQDDAVLLTMLTGGALPLARARAVIAARPDDGWSAHEAFWAQPALAGIAVPNAVLSQLALRTRYFDLHAQVEYDNAQVVLTALFDHRAPGDTRLAARRWTTHE
ncbi:type II secretion system minor pseudopilin GspK [Lysobacter sp. A3-1-A15]|uniref:type II secretion system minor pseudopilin GspK n=1 Tax=Novilysobacter viscosus TaxID=3098602 RepID=UPI003983172C